MLARESFCPVLRCGPARCEKNGVIFRHMTNSFARSPAAAVGALLAVATIPLLLLLTKTQSEQFAAMILAAMGAIYIIHRIWPAKGQPRPDCDRVDRRHGILCCGIGGSLGHSVDRSGCLCRAWNLGLCAPPRLKARIRTLKARRHTLMVSFILRRLRLGGGGILGGYVEPAGLNDHA